MSQPTSEPAPLHHPPRLVVGGTAYLANVPSACVAIASACIALAFALCLFGCGGDGCTPGESRCDGAGTLSCGSGGDGPFAASHAFSALSRGCGSDRCIDVVDHGLRAAVCSTTGEEDPRCAPDKRGAVCVSDRTRLVCGLGYSSGEETCGACVTSAGSSVSSPVTICGLEATMNPVCKGASDQSCDGAAVVDCLRGWVTSRKPCEAISPTCVLSTTASNVGHALCAHDEPCAGKDTTRCESGGVRGCVAGHVVSSTCDASEQCRDYFDRAQCERRCENVASGVCLDP